MNQMNELTFPLLAVGLGLIVLVLAFNWWQARKIRKAAEKQFEMPQADVLMEEAAALALEPQVLHAEVGVSDINLSDDVVFEIDVEEVTEAIVATVPDRFDVLDDEIVAPIGDAMMSEQFVADDDLVSEPANTLEVENVIAKPLPEGISVEVDLTATLHLPEPLTGERLRQFLIGLVNLDKPIFAYALDENQIWQHLTREQEQALFTKVVYSLQLADRAGPVSDDTLKRFQQMISEVAYSLSAQVEWVGNDDPLAYAQRLDAFCLEVDKIVGFHVVNGAAGRFTGTKFKGLAEANGLILNDQGAFVLAEDGPVLFSVINMEKNPFGLEMLKSAVIKGVSFKMDIARTPNCTETFNRMVVMAKSMALALNATLVDDHQRELSDSQIEKIRQQLKLIQVQMTVRGVPPGAPLALRLFS